MKINRVFFYFVFTLKSIKKRNNHTTVEAEKNLTS